MSKRQRHLRARQQEIFGQLLPSHFSIATDISKIHQNNLNFYLFCPVFIFHINSTHINNKRKECGYMHWIELVTFKCYTYLIKRKCIDTKKSLSPKPKSVLKSLTRSLNVRWLDGRSSYIYSKMQFLYTYNYYLWDNDLVWSLTQWNTFIVITLIFTD